MADLIGLKWQEGELLVRKGAYHDGIMCFLKARQMALNDKKVFVDQNSISRNDNRYY